MANEGYDVANKSLQQLEEMDKNYRLELFMGKRTGEISKQDYYRPIEGRPEPRETEHHKEVVRAKELYQITRNEYISGKDKLMGNRVEHIINECKKRIYPSPKYLEQFNEKDKEKILRHIPYVGTSSILYDRGGVLIDLEGNIIKKEKKKDTKEIWKF